MTHAELVELARKWLVNRCTVVITEISTTAWENPDAIGWKGNSTLIECKTSRADFKTDAKKLVRQQPAMGIGDERYYLCPAGLISVDELPEKWGLLEVKASGEVRMTKRAEHIGGDKRQETMILLSAIKRIPRANDGLGISARLYHEQAWNKNKATITMVADLEAEAGPYWDNFVAFVEKTQDFESLNFNFLDSAEKYRKVFINANKKDGSK